MVPGRKAVKGLKFKLISSPLTFLVGPVSGALACLLQADQKQAVSSLLEEVAPIFGPSSGVRPPYG